MANPTKPDRQDAWLTKRQMLGVLDISQAAFDQGVRRYVRPEHVKQDGRRLLFYCRGVLDSWYSRHSQGKSPDPEAECELALLLGNFKL